MAYRSSSFVAGASGTSVVVPVPSGAATNDIATVGVYVEAAGTVSAPDGSWTQKADLATNPTTQGRLVVFWKRLTAGDTGNYTFTTPSTWGSGVCVLHSGRDGTGDPFDGTVGTAESGTTVSTSPPVSTSPTGSNGDAVHFATDYTGGNSYTQPTNYTERQDNDTIGLFTRDAVASGSTGSVTAALGVSGFSKAFIGVLGENTGLSSVTATRDTTWNVVSNMVTRVATNTGTASGTASVAAFSPTLPTHAAGDRMTLFVQGKYNTTTVPTINQGWTLVGSGTGGTGTTGNDAGQVFWAVYQKDATSSSETAPTVTPGATAPNSWTHIVTTHRLSSGVWRDSIAASAAYVQSASDTNTGSPLTGTTGAFTGAVPETNDAIFVVGVIPTDLGSAIQSPTLTVSGLSGGTLSNATGQYVENSLGQDSASMWMGWTGFSGTATAGAAISFTVTSSTNHSGALVAVALRKINQLQVTATRDTTWGVDAQVTATRATTWNVGYVKVTATRATTWAVKARVTGTRATTWTVFSDKAWPASISGKHILDSNGDPWFMIMDHQWNLLSWGGGRNELGGGTTPLAVFQGYAATQSARGINAVLVLAINSDQNGEVGPFTDGRLHDGVPVWTGGGITSSDIGNMNATYWDRLEDLVSACQVEGMVVVLNILSAYSIATGTALAALNATNAATYGTALGNRFKDYPNIIWQIGVDYFGDNDTELDELVNAVQATGDTHLWTIEYYAESGSRVEAGGTSGSFGSNTDINFDDVYTYNASYVEVERSYSYTTGGNKPAIYMNGYYDQGSAGGGTADYHDMADQWGWAITSGSAGIFYGSESTWQWGSGAYAALSTLAWTSTTGPMIDTITWLMASEKWHLLIPDFDSSFLTGTRGTKLGAITPSGGSGTAYAGGTNTYLTGAVTADGSFAVIYTPTSRTITINNAELTTFYDAYWRDPYTGNATAAASNATSYATPGTNSQGHTNWYLVIEEATTAPVTATRSTTWDVLSQRTATRATTFDVLAQVTATRATTYDVLAQVSSTRATTYDVLARVTSTRATTYDVLARVTSSRATTWDTAAQVTATRATTWNVQATGQVSASRSTTWDVRTVITKTAATSWDVLSQRTASRATTFDVLSARTASRSTTFDVLSARTSSRATSWDVLARVTQSKSTTWNVASLGGSSYGYVVVDGVLKTVNDMSVIIEGTKKTVAAVYVIVGGVKKPI